MSETIKIPGRIESVATGNIVTGANAILDDTKGKKQNVINEETDAELVRLEETEQGNLTFDQTPMENSTNPVTSGGVYAADQLLSEAIEAILLLIPSAASELNKLVDLATMNSSISTATASFKGTYNLVSDLHLTVSATHAQIAAALDALSLGADNNDYAFVQVPNTDTAPTDIAKTERYKFNGENWAYEYDLNNSGFTTAQWNAINSGITTLLVAKLSALPTNDALTLTLAGKQDNLTFDNAPTAGSNNPVKSGGIYTRNNEIVALIDALDSAKQNVLTFDTTPTNGSTNPVTSNGVYLAIQLVQTAVVALDGRMGTAETKISTAEGNIVNLQAAYAALTQSDIVVVEGVLPSSGQQNIIYRQPDQDHTPPQFYSDYMWNSTAWVLMATYNNAIDPRPKKGSQNLVTSGGVFDNMGALDVSELNATENPHTLKPYATLDDALADIPSDYQKGGMSVKFVRSSDNKYVQYRLMSDTFNTTPANWQGVDDEPTAGSENLVKSGGVYEDLRKIPIDSKECVFDFSSGNVAQYANRNVDFKFIKDHKYKIEVETADNTTTTYFSVRNDAGQVVNNQKEINTGKGARSVNFICTENGTKFYMSYKEAGVAILYSVKITDITIASIIEEIAAVDEEIAAVDEETTKIGITVKDTLELAESYLYNSFVFTNTGKVINITGEEIVSNNYRRSNVVQMQAGQKVTFNSEVATNGFPCIILTNADGTSFTPVVFADNISVKKYSYYAEENCYIVLQYWLTSGTPYIIYDSERLIKIEKDIDALNIEQKSLNYDVSRNFPTGGLNGGNTYTLQTALAKVPNEYRIGNITVSFIDSITNKYVGWHLNSGTWQTFNSGYWESDTEIIKSLRNTGVPIFEYGGFYYSSSNSSVNYYPASNEIRTKNGTCISLEKGSVIRLLDYTNAKFRVLYNNGSYVDSEWRTSDWTCPVTTNELYVKLMTNDSTAIDLNEYSALLVIDRTNKKVSSIEYLVNNLEDTLDMDSKPLPIVVFNTTRTFVIKGDGTTEASTNWVQSNVFTLYKGQTVKMTSKGTGGSGAVMCKVSSEIVEGQTIYSYTPVLVYPSNQNYNTYVYTADEDCEFILQYYYIQGSPALYNESNRLADIESELTIINDSIDSIRKDIYYPEYVEAEKERVYRELIERANADAAIVAFNTDQHFNVDAIGTGDYYDPKFMMNGLKSLRDTAAKIPFDCIVLGGDVAGYGGGSSNTIKGILEDVNILTEPFSDLNIPFVSIPGNHDAYQNNENITAQGMYNVHFKKSKWMKNVVHSGTDNCDCYFDDEDKKIRYIFVDTYSRNGRTESYNTFISSALSSMDNDYQCIIFSHNPLTSEFTGVVKHITHEGTEGDAFANPTDLHSTIDAYASQVIACICGHSHDDVFAISQSGILYIETTTAGLAAISHFQNIPYQRTRNTVTDTAYDIFVINRTNQTIEAIRYGQGTNRLWKYKGAEQGLISYKNCLSGICNVHSVVLTFTNNGNNIEATIDSDGKYEVYLELGKEYTISCTGYTLDISTVTLSQNTELNLTLTAE